MLSCCGCRTNSVMAIVMVTVGISSAAVSGSRNNSLLAMFTVTLSISNIFYFRI